MVFSGPSGFLHQYNWPLRYIWNIVESGVKHNKTKPALEICAKFLYSSNGLRPDKISYITIEKENMSTCNM
jgi:hypothetical protein